MEVHQHSHINHSKRWKNYLYEFLMLFLAVSAGFFMENLREHHVENEREEKYMKSFVTDLKSDLVNIDSTIARNLLAKMYYDSLFYLLTLPDHSDKFGEIYFISRKVSLREFFYQTDGTLTQLINSGGLRLVHHQEIVDSINAYQNIYEVLKKGQLLKELQLEGYRDACCKVFDVRIYEKIMAGTKMTRPEGNPKLLSENLEYINELLMRAHYVKRNNAGSIELLEIMKRKALNMQRLINQKYHFE